MARPPRTRALSEADRALWRHVAKSVEPLRRRPVETVQEPPKRLGPPRAEPMPADPPAAPARPPAHPPLSLDRLANWTPRPKAPPRPSEPPPELSSHAGVDRRTSARLRRGQLPIDAKLDLHGMTQEQARNALFSFVGSGVQNGWRCVLVVTGKGLRGPESGVLRRAVPRWLNDSQLRTSVVATAAARPQHGGEGALYLLLRRRREG